MLVVKFDKIVLEACLFKTFHSNARRIYAESRCACVRRYALCVNCEEISAFRYPVFLQFRLGKCLFKPFFKLLFCRNYGRAVITYRIWHKAAVHRYYFGAFWVCRHCYTTFFAVYARKACVGCKAAGQFLRNLVVMLHTFWARFLVTTHNQTNTLIEFCTWVTK